MNTTTNNYYALQTVNTEVCSGTPTLAKENTDKLSNKKITHKRVTSEMVTSTSIQKKKLKQNSDDITKSEVIKRIFKQKPNSYGGCPIKMLENKLLDNIIKEFKKDLLIKNNVIASFNPSKTLTRKAKKTNTNVYIKSKTGKLLTISNNNYNSNITKDKCDKEVLLTDFAAMEEHHNTILSNYTNAASNQRLSEKDSESSSLTQETILNKPSNFSISNSFSSKNNTNNNNGNNNDNKNTNNNNSNNNEENTLPTGKFLYNIDGEFATITGYTGSEERLVIPAMIDGYTVREIADSAFSSNQLKSIIITNGIEKIGWFAFQNCPTLIAITIPDSVSSIGYSAFPTQSKNFTIYCSNNSFAQQYAKSYGISYTVV